MNMSLLSSGFGSIYMIALWILILFSIYALIRIFILPEPPGQKRQMYLDILKQRYVNGEISTDEFHQMKRVLFEDQE